MTKEIVKGLGISILVFVFFLIPFEVGKQFGKNEAILQCTQTLTEVLDNTQKIQIRKELNKDTEY